MIECFKRTTNAWRPSLSLPFWPWSLPESFASPIRMQRPERTSQAGTVNEITIAPGYSWSYQATFPSDLTAEIAISFEINKLGDNATLDGHTLKIGTIANSMAGNSYNIVLKAYHTASEQASHQWIRINVNAEMSMDYSGCINEILKGASQNITLSSQGGIGTVAWSTISMPAGLTLSNNTISGTPSEVGLNTIQVKANSSQEQTKDLEI